MSKSYLSAQIVSSGFVKAYTDQGSGANQDLTVFWPGDRSFEGYFYLGNVAVQGYPEQPEHPVFYVKAENDDPANPCLLPPTGFTRIWIDSGDGGDYDKTIWRPVAPDGYVAIGDVAWNYTEPRLADFPGLRCVRQDLLRFAHPVQPAIWGDWDSGADNNVSLWDIRTNDKNETSGYFVATAGYDEPQGPLFDVKRL